MPPAVSRNTAQHQELERALYRDIETQVLQSFHRVTRSNQALDIPLLQEVHKRIEIMKHHVGRLEFSTQGNVRKAGSKKAYEDRDVFLAHHAKRLLTHALRTTEGDARAEEMLSKL